MSRLMNTFPEPWNPENLPPAAPGYRYLGKDESLKHECDELWNPDRWMSIKETLAQTRRYLHWTYRRPINVDDPAAPPPEEWTKPGYEVIKGPLPEGEYEAWDQHSKAWKGGCCGSGDYLYYRRPLPANTTPSTPSMTTSTPSKVVLKPGQSIVVNVHQNEALSRAVQEIAFAAGWEWPWPGHEHKYFPGLPDRKVLYIYIDPNKCLSWDDKQLTGRADGLHLNARTDLGTLIDLLAAPQITPPEIRGSDGKDYKAQYAKGEDVVTFGCAKLGVGMLKVAASLMRLTPSQDGRGPWRDCNIESLKGNRTVRAIELDSGVKLTREDIKATLDYVDAVNKAG